MNGLKATWRALGVRGFAAYATGRAVAFVPGAALFNYRLIAVPRAGMPPMPRGHRVTEMSAADLERARADLELPEAALRHRMGQGMSCLAAWRGDRLLGVTFVIAGPFEEDEVDIRFAPPPGAAWDTGLYVRPGYRPGRAFAALWAGTSDWLAARGLDWSISRIIHHNSTALSSHARMGGVVVGSLSVLRLGGVQWRFGAKREVTPQLPGRT